MIITNAIYLLARILPKNETLLVKFILPNWWSYLLHKYDIPALFLNHWADWQSHTHPKMSI